MCNFHGLTKKKLFYAFLVSGRSRNPAIYMKDSFLQQYLTASSRHCCATADYNHLSPETVGICTRVHHQVTVENIKEI